MSVSRMNHVEFISYTGECPNLCSGVLTLKINEEIVTFGNGNDAQFPSFWDNCGYWDSCEHPNSKGEWTIRENLLPDQYREYIDEIDAEFNGNVPHGVCYGCR